MSLIFKLAADDTALAILTTELLITHVALCTRYTVQIFQKVSFQFIVKLFAFFKILSVRSTIDNEAPNVLSSTE